MLLYPLGPSEYYYSTFTILLILLIKPLSHMEQTWWVRSQHIGWAFRAGYKDNTTGCTPHGAGI